jgi:hypothetical protein
MLNLVEMPKRRRQVYYMVPRSPVVRAAQLSEDRIAKSATEMNRHVPPWLVKLITANMIDD